MIDPAKKIRLSQRFRAHQHIAADIEQFASDVRNRDLVPRLRAAEAGLDQTSLHTFRREVAHPVDLFLRTENAVPFLAGESLRRVGTFHDLVLRAYFSLEDPSDPLLPDPARRVYAAHACGLWVQVLSEGERLCAYLRKTISGT